METTNEYLPEVIASIPQPRREANELSVRRIVLHSLLFLATIATTTLTGAAWPLLGEASSILGVYKTIITSATAGDFGPLLPGIAFSFTLLIILAAHEFGHYFACRYYGIRATLPFFIPAPPIPLTPFGTFGAVIRIKEPITTRRALFDIGIAGPLAGFALALPASIIGLLIAHGVTPPAAGAEGTLSYNDPLLFIIIQKLLGLPKWIDWNPIYWAAWATLLVTALNLFPVGQLDGGHVVYAIFGPTMHKWISRLTFLAVATLAVVSFVLYRSPIWFLWTVVLLFLLRVGHPPTFTNEPLGKGRIALAAAAAIAFILAFMPFPITIS